MAFFRCRHDNNNNSNNNKKKIHTFDVGVDTTDLEMTEMIGKTFPRQPGQPQKNVPRSTSQWWSHPSPRHFVGWIQNKLPAQFFLKQQRNNRRIVVLVVLVLLGGTAAIIGGMYVGTSYMPVGSFLGGLGMHQEQMLQHGTRELKKRFPGTPT